ncbi:FAD-dependent oxidoreductase [Salinibacterium sp. GXW1014]|uniref:FAD-dependent oxidoreductase n=1 Tax=Salinibacterium sp. GXW1014 TaxID=3377838 RepID=UPI00383AFC90
MTVFDDGIAATELGKHGMVETDVLVVGSGPSGAAMSLALSTYGIPNINVTKYRWTANTPRAHITNQRAMEFFRDMGVLADVEREATPHELVGDTVFCSAIAGEEFGRIRAWGTSPRRHADYESASPVLNSDMPQHLLEPILVKHAAARGSQVRFSAEYVRHEQDATGVTTTVLDRTTGLEYTVRSKYLYGADGARSKVAADIGLDFEGQMDIAGSMNITFKADLEHLVGHRPSVLYWVVKPGANVGGIGAGLVRMVRPWNEWLIVWGYDINQPAPSIDFEAAKEIVFDLLGTREIDVEITGTSLWGNNEMYATTVSNGRVFCGGDAIHRHPPSNGLGSNTSIQDSYNLAWKLAAVLRGYAGANLLESYQAERAPVAKQIVTRANQSSREFGGFFDALGVTSAEDQQGMLDAIAERTLDTDAGRARRAALIGAMELKNYEFNAHGVELGQFYESNAVVSDGSPKPSTEGLDPELYYTPGTAPGAPLPHAWVGDSTQRLSTLDLAPSTQFTVFTGIAGDPWAEAAERIAARTGIPVKAVVIGPGRQVTDLYYDWAKLRGVEEDGVLLVRPDKIVAFRSISRVDDPEAALEAALNAVLSRENAH